MLKENDCFRHIYIRTGYTDLWLGIDGLVAVIRKEVCPQLSEIPKKHLEISASAV